jgi:hypothetical protein
MPADLLFGICTVPPLYEIAVLGPVAAALLAAAALDTLIGIWMVPDLTLPLPGDETSL